MYITRQCSYTHNIMNIRVYDMGPLIFNIFINKIIMERVIVILCSIPT